MGTAPAASLRDRVATIGVRGGDRRTLHGRAILADPAAPRVGRMGLNRRAERLRGISYDRLVAEGLPAEQVFEGLAGAVGGARLFADSHLDGSWMRTLAVAAGRAPIGVGHVEEVIARVGASDDEFRTSIEAA